MTYSIENEFFKAAVKTHGAELTSLYSKTTGIEYLWQGDPAIWAGQSPVLFPIIGRVLDDRYRLNGVEYTMPKHGFFRNREAELYEKSASRITFVQRDDEETRKLYPYAFEVFVTFELIGKSIRVTHTVANRNDRVMYFSIGAHPAFACRIGDHLLFEKKETLDTVAIDTECLRTSQMIPVLKENNEITITKDIFNQDALIFTGMKSSYITLVSDQHDRKIKFNYGGCPYLGIWAKPGAPYVCLEPWWGVNDSHEKKADFSEKDAIQSLPAGENYTCFWQAEITE